MKLTIISDTHGYHEGVTLPNGDILIHCGDFSSGGQPIAVERFLKWYNKQPHPHKILLAGNHDISFQKNPEWKVSILNKLYLQDSNHHYLENSGIEIEGIKFFGSPYTPKFFNWVFMYKRRSNEAYKIWRAVPSNTDVIISHGPPKEVLDKCNNHVPPHPDRAGCEVMRKIIRKIKPKYCLFGHIHEGYGLDERTLAPTTCINASTMNGNYQPINPAVEIEI